MVKCVDANQSNKESIVCLHAGNAQNYQAILSNNNVIIIQMLQTQQNKQKDEPKRVSNLKFLSIKSIIRNKKIIVKKTVQVPAIFSRNNNTFSTCDLLPTNIQLLKDEITHRGFTTHKHNTQGIGTSIVNIKFGEDKSNLHKHSQQKIRKKLTNTFNLCGDDLRKPVYSTKDRAQFGCVQDSLIIEPLQKLQNHFGWDKKKGFYNYMLVTKKPKVAVSSEPKMICDMNQDFRQYGKQITQIQFNRKKRHSSKPRKTTTSFLNNQKTFEQIQQKECKTLNLTGEKKNIQLVLDQAELQKRAKQKQLQRIKQKQLNQALLREYKQLIPIRKPSNKKDYFVFGMSQKPAEPQNKIQLFRDFLWKVNYSNGLYVFTPQNVDFSYKAFVGFGNNSCMVKSILRRRSWWTIVDSSTQSDTCNFVWTQLKINMFFKNQINRIQNKQQKQNQQQQISDNQFKLQQYTQQQQMNFLTHRKIFNRIDNANWQQHMRKNAKTQQKISEQTHVKRIKLYTKKQITKIMDSQKIKIHNHLQFNYYLGNKKALFYNIKRLCEFRNQNPFDYVPITFHISKGTQDPTYQKFLTYFKKLQDLKNVDKNFRNIWICKPGQNTNRGNGISVCSGLDDIRHRLRGKEKNSDGKLRTFILQKYIQKPLLYKNRKFDIRHYMLLTCFNGNMKAYWFEEGYIRTSSSIFNLKNSNDLMVHLTNDAVQKKGDTYGKHQKGNKISYQDFQKYIDANFKKKHDFLGKTLSKMKKIALTAVEATYFLLDPNRKQNNFQLIGLDFMIDQNFKPWLIQANTNPCLQLSSPLLQKLIPSVIQQTFRICVDPFFPPPENCTIKNKFFGQNALLQNRYQLIFDESVDGQKIRRLFKQRQANNSEYNDLICKIEQDNQVFEDDGNQNWEQKNNS